MLSRHQLCISVLTLFCNNLNDDCMEALGEYIQNNNHLETLSIGYNQITDNGINKLSKTVLNNIILKDLDLHLSKLLTDACVPFLKIIAERTCITTICLTETSISKENQKEIEKVFMKPLEERYVFKILEYQKETIEDTSHSLQSSTMMPMQHATEIRVLAATQSLVYAELSKIIEAKGAVETAASYVSKSVSNVDMNSPASTTTGPASLNPSSSNLSRQTSPPCLRMLPELCNIGEKIHKGSFADIYRGTYNGDTVAIKIFKNQKPSREEWTRIKNEIELMKQVNNLSNIIQFYLFNDDPNAKDANDNQLGICVVLEYATNGSLHSALFKSQSKPDFKTRLNILCGVAQGLQHLHNCKPYPIAHLDLTPKNILLNHCCTPKLSDFGSAVATQPRTQITGGLTGTCSYSSPELLSSENRISNLLPSDIWAFGCVIYDCIMPQQVWEGLDKHKIIENVCKKKKNPTVLETKPLYDETPLIDLMQKCFNFDAKDRPTIHQIRSKLEEFKPSSGDAYLLGLRSIELKVKGIQSSIQDMNKQLEASNNLLTSLAEGNNLCFKFFTVKTIQERKYGMSPYTSYLIPLCEYDFHECSCGKHGNGYIIQDKKEFCKSYKTVINFVVFTLQLTVNAFGGTPKFNAMFATMKEFMQGEKALDFEFNFNEKEIKEACSIELRKLNKEIEEIDPGKTFLNMSAVANKRGKVGWVCEKHIRSWKEKDD